MRYLGLDFGTVWTKASIYDTDFNDFSLVRMDSDVSEHADFELIGGKYACPSVVFVTKEGRYVVGKEAARTRLLNPRKFYDKFKLELSNPNNSESIIFSEEVIKFAYQKALEQNDNKPFDGITITVPSSTVENDIRWERMSKILNELGISNFNIIKEPEAAAYYILSEAIKNEQFQNGEIILVYDFGGGTFDPALVEIKGKTIRILGEWDFNQGRNLGGIYIDYLIGKDILSNVPLFQTEVIDFLGNIPKDELGRELIDTTDKQFIKDYNSALTYGLELSELRISAKHFFSNNNEAIYQKATHAYSYSLSRDDYYDIINQAIEDTISCCDDLISQYGGWNIISRVILVGGSSLIPLVKEKFNKKKEEEHLHYNIFSPKDIYGTESGILHAVSIGASMFEALQPSNYERICFGCRALEIQDYAEAEFQFKKANSLYWQYVMSYEGIGQKIIYKLLRERICDRLNMLTDYNDWTEDDYCLALLDSIILFKGQGCKKDDEKLAAGLLPIIKSLQEKIPSYGNEIVLPDPPSANIFNFSVKGFVKLVDDFFALLRKINYPKSVKEMLLYKLNLLLKASTGSASASEYEQIYHSNFHRIDFDLYQINKE